MGVSHTPFMAGNLLLFDEIRFYTAAIYPSFAHVRAYAIRPYSYSVKIKRISTKHIVENFPYHHFWSAINPSFAAMRAYAIRPYTCSLKFKRISPKYIIKKLLFHHSLAAIYISFAAVRADAIRPDT